MGNIYIDSQGHPRFKNSGKLLEPFPSRRKAGTKLIEQEVLKIPVPPELGEAPVYKVRPPRKGGRSQGKSNFSSGRKPNRRDSNQN